MIIVYNARDVSTFIFILVAIGAVLTFVAYAIETFTAIFINKPLYYEYFPLSVALLTILFIWIVVSLLKKLIARKDAEKKKTVLKKTRRFLFLSLIICAGLFGAADIKMTHFENKYYSSEKGIAHTDLWKSMARQFDVCIPGPFTDNKLPALSHNKKVLQHSNISFRNTHCSRRPKDQNSSNYQEKIDLAKRGYSFMKVCIGENNTLNNKDFCKDAALLKERFDIDLVATGTKAIKDYGKDVTDSFGITSVPGFRDISVEKTFASLNSISCNESNICKNLRDAGMKPFSEFAETTTREIEFLDSFYLEGQRVRCRTDRMCHVSILNALKDYEKIRATRR